MSDLHIGFRRFDRLGAGGRNQIELDVVGTFARAVDAIIDLAPDVVLVAGDVFHHANPRPLAVITAFNGFSRLVRALPQTAVVVCSGNHDIPKTSDIGTIMPIFEELGIHVADRDSKRFYFPERDLSVLAVPDAPSLARPELKPDSRARYNCLCLHGEVQGMLPRWKTDSRNAQEITNEEIGVDAWDLIALGHWHIYKQLAPNMAYSGSLDFVSSNPWQEIDTPKGFILWDLAARTREFIVIEPSRRYLDLPPIDAHGMGAEQLDTAIRDAAESAGDLTGCVVRLIVEGVSRELGRALDQKNLKTVRRGTLNFQIDLRRPAYVESALSMMVRGVDQPGARAKTVEERTKEKLEGRELAPDVDRGDLITMAMKYLADAKERDLPRTVDEDTSNLHTAAPRQAQAVA